jgi:hypothetical protein
MSIHHVYLLNRELHSIPTARNVRANGRRREKGKSKKKNPDKLESHVIN